MPTTTVTTWPQFKAAYTAAEGTESDPHIIEIMADLNCNDDPLTAGLNAGNYYKIINGNYHKIDNLSTQTVVNAVLLQGRYVTYNKCNFVNMLRNENYSFFGGSYTNYSQYFYDCTIQGKGYAIAGSGVFNRCVITWESARTYAGHLGSCYCSYCYITLNYKRDSSSNYDINTLTNCFVKGKIEGANGNTAGWHLVGSAVNSCINIDTDLNYPLGLTGQSSASSIASAYNTDKMTGTIADQSNLNIKPVTDAQMQDAAYLASIGLNIIV